MLYIPWMFYKLWKGKISTGDEIAVTGIAEQRQAPDQKFLYNFYKAFIAFHIRLHHIEIMVHGCTIQKGRITYLNLEWVRPLLSEDSSIEHSFAELQILCLTKQQ